MAGDSPIAPGQPVEVPVPPAPERDHLISNKLYDILKRIVQLVLPALVTLWLAVGALWDAPHLQEVAGTLTALTTFLGVLLGLSDRSYNNSDAKYDGTIHVTEDENGLKHAALVLKNYQNRADVVLQKQVTFKVSDQPNPQEAA